MNELLMEKTEELTEESLPWVVISIDKQFYAINAVYVREVMETAAITAVPRMPQYVRGVMNLRGSIIPVLDTRIFLGMTSLVHITTSLIDLLHGREQDHKNWLSRLESSVRDGSVFDGELDPHKCAFGKWYDGYQTDNPYLRPVLNRFDEPHRAIHAVGGKVKELQARGENERAMQLVQETHDRELDALVKLFNEAREIIEAYHREIVVVLDLDGASCSITADTAESVEMLNPSEEGLINSGAAAENKVVFGTAERPGSGQLVMLLDVNLIAAGSRI